MFTSDSKVNNVFESGVLRSYNENWQVEDSRKFNEAELDAIQSAKVTRGDYGLSVCFLMKNGKTFFIPVSTRNTELTENQEVDAKSIVLLTLNQNGRKCLKIQ